MKETWAVIFRNGPIVNNLNPTGDYFDRIKEYYPNEWAATKAAQQAIEDGSKYTTIVVKLFTAFEPKVSANKVLFDEVDVRKVATKKSATPKKSVATKPSVGKPVKKLSKSNFNHKVNKGK